MDSVRQAIYVAGAIDMLTDFAPDTAASIRGMHYYQCIREGRINNGQLSDNVLAFARSTPEVQKMSAQAAIIQYLNRLCGTPR